MAFEVVFANVKLHEYFNILQVKRTILPSRTNFTKEIPGINGQKYTGFKYNPKKITLSCYLTAEDNDDFADKVRNIAFILDTKEPSKMILGDSVDMYNYAVVAGDTDISKICRFGKFDIDFMCYDPISYSIKEDEFYADADKIITVENGGTTEAHPKISVDFTQNAHFLQCTNYDGQTILVGTPPAIDKVKVVYPSVVLADGCGSLTGWVSTSNVLDVGREITGNLVVNQGGYAICLGNVGTGTAWHGGALRKNLSQNLSEFNIQIKMEHNSKGDIKGTGSTSVTPPVVTSEYIVKASPSLRVRSGRGTNFAKIGSYVNGTTVTVTEISQNWGKVNYNGNIGYISMDYVNKKVVNATISGGTYKVNASSGLNLRTGRGTKYQRLTAIPFGTQVSVTEISEGWGKITYAGKTGYSTMQYLSKISVTAYTPTTPATTTNSTYEAAKEECIGLVEIYGYDINGNKLFKAMLKDSEQFYEDTEPYVELGSTIVLQDSNKCPAPKTVTATDEDGKTVMKDGIATTRSIDSGKFGDWNEFAGYFTIERSIKNGKQYWKAKIEKVADGKVVRTIETQTLNGSYPTGSLNNIVIFIGGYAENVIVDAMNISEINVTNISNAPAADQIKPIFKQGDELVIDTSKQKIYKNGKLFMNELDIGSQFFSCPVGESEFICKSDDKNIDVISTIQKRWL